MDLRLFMRGLFLRVNVLLMNNPWHFLKQDPILSFYLGVLHYIDNQNNCYLPEAPFFWDSRQGGGISLEDLQLGFGASASCEESELAFFDSQPKSSPGNASLNDYAISYSSLRNN